MIGEHACCSSSSLRSNSFFSARVFSFNHVSASSTFAFAKSLSSELNFPSTAVSSIVCFTRYAYLSKLFLAESRSRCLSSSSLYFSASATIRVTSALDKRPLSFVMVMELLLPVLVSSAETFRIPLASMSNDT